MITSPPGGALRDASGDIYITGGASDSTAEGRIHLLKYKPNGDLEWATTFGEPGKSYAAFGSIAIDDSQSVYVCGRSESASCSIVRISKYQSDGTLVGVTGYRLRGDASLWPGRFTPSTTVTYIWLRTSSVRLLVVLGIAIGSS